MEAHAVTLPLKVSLYPFILHLLHIAILPLALAFPDSYLIFNSFSSQYPEFAHAVIPVSQTSPTSVILLPTCHLIPLQQMPKKHYSPTPSSSLFGPQSGNKSTCSFARRPEINVDWWGSPSRLFLSAFSIPAVRKTKEPVFHIEKPEKNQVLNANVLMFAEMYCCTCSSSS